MRKIWITGASGQLGYELKRISDRLGICHFTTSAEVDITDSNAVARFWQEGKFDMCINTAAYTAVDKAETETALAYAVNAESVGFLAQQAQLHRADFIHISTDYVFDGSCTGLKKETDPTAPLNQYGITKLAGENLAFRYCEKAIVLRTSWLYGRHGKNFVKTMLRLSQTQPYLRVVADQIGSPTCAEDLALAIAHIASRPLPGIYHFANQGAISWFDFAKAIFELKHIDVQVEPISSSEFPTLAKRPAYSVMDTKKIASTFGIEIPYWRDSLKKMLPEIQS